MESAVALVKSFSAELKSVSFQEAILWEKPRASGIIVGSVLLMALVFGVFEYTILTFVCRMAQLALLIGGTGMYFGYVTLDPVAIKSHIRTAISDAEPIIIAAVEAVARILTWENRRVSSYIFGGSFVVAALGNIFSDLTMVLLVTIGLFVIPPLYTQNRSIIDPNVKLVSDSIKSYVNSIKTKAKTA